MAAIIDDVLLAALAASMAEGATAAAAPAVAGATAAAPAVAEAGMAAIAPMAEGLGEASLSQVMPAAEGATPGVAGVGGMFGRETPEAMSQAGQIGTEGNPWKDRMLGASMGLSMASKLIPNSSARNTLNLMAMGTGAAANADPKETMGMIRGPLDDIARTTQKDEEKRLSQVMPMPQAMAPTPTTQQPTPGGPTTNGTPAALASGLPSPNVVDGPIVSMTPEQRLRMLRGY